MIFVPKVATMHPKVKRGILKGSSQDVSKNGSSASIHRSGTAEADIDMTELGELNRCSSVGEGIKPYALKPVFT